MKNCYQKDLLHFVFFIYLLIQNKIIRLIENSLLRPWKGFIISNDNSFGAHTMFKSLQFEAIGEKYSIRHLDISLYYIDSFC